MVTVFCVLRATTNTKCRRLAAGNDIDAQQCVDGGQLLIVSPLRARTKEPDEACAQAVDLARHAAEEMAGPEGVGEHLGTSADGDRVVTHLFRCLDPAYRGWCWAVTVARASRAKNVTVCESLLIPGSEAILAPDWLPWRERLRPGDLGVGDILPAPPDDIRLVPVVSLEGDDGIADWGEATWATPGAEPVDLIPAGFPADSVSSGDSSGPVDWPGLADLASPDLRADPTGGPGDLGEGQPGATGQAGDARASAGPESAGSQSTAPESAGAETAAAGSAAAHTDETAPAQTAAAETAVAEAGGADAAVETRPARARVLSAIGRDDAAFRWYTSEHGPKTPLAHAAPGLCAGCGFFVRLAGPLGRVFGVCANAYAPDDGRVVSSDHGCGAHSEAVFAPTADQPLRPVIDELGYDLVDMPGVSVEETVFEPLDHN